MRPILFTLFTAALLTACGDGPRRSRTRTVATGDQPTAPQADGGVAAVDGGATGPAPDAGPIPTPDAGDIPSPAGALAPGLNLQEVAVYQAVKIPIFRDGRAIPDRNSPLVRGRPALIRVFVQPAAEWQPREVAVRLSLEARGQAAPDLVIRKFVSGASSEENADSTFNFQLPGADFTADLLYAVSIEEVQGGVNAPGSTSASRFPVEGSATLGVEDAGDALKIVLVPVRYNADDSGRLPDTSPAQLERLRAGMFGTYPTPEVEITVHQPVSWSGAVEPFGEGWGELLQGVLRLRQDDNVRTNVYYYGIVAPADSMRAFCGRGCVAGLSTLSGNPRDDYVRGSIGLGFSGDNGVGTFIHEVGHAHGRRHAPCGLGNQPSDPGFPYSSGSIGVYGFDVESGTLMSPSRHADMMSYCDPRWVSDYTYAALFERISFVNSIAFFRAAPDWNENWRTISIGADGTPSYGAAVQLRSVPGGEPREVLLYDDYGRIVSKTTGYFYPYSHIPGGFTLVPEPQTGVRTIELEGLAPIPVP